MEGCTSFTPYSLKKRKKKKERREGGLEEGKECRNVQGVGGRKAAKIKKEEEDRGRLQTSIRRSAIPVTCKRARAPVCVYVRVCTFVLTKRCPKDGSPKCSSWDVILRVRFCMVFFLSVSSILLLHCLALPDGDGLYLSSEVIQGHHFRCGTK